MGDIDSTYSKGRKGEKMDAVVPEHFLLLFGKVSEINALGKW